MKTHIFFLAVTALAFQCSAAVEATRNLFWIENSPHETNLVVGEPLFLKASVSNATAEGVALVARVDGPGYYGFGANGGVQVSDDGVEFRELRVDSTRDSVMSRPVRLRPKAVVSDLFTVLYGRNGELAFPKPGHYWVRTRFMISQADEAYWVVSPPLRVTVTQPNSEDAPVWSLLSTNQTYEALAQAPAQAALQSSQVDAMMALILSHTNTTYAPYLALFLARNLAEGKNRLQQTNYLRARFLLGSLVRFTSNSDLREKAAAVLANVEAIESSIREADRRQMRTNAVDAVVKKLEREWYDVKGLLRGRYEGFREFGRTQVQTVFEFNAGKISGEESDGRLAEQLSNYAAKSGKQLAPDEWRKRYAEYEREDAEQAAKRAKELERKTQLDEALDQELSRPNSERGRQP